MQISIVWLAKPRHAKAALHDITNFKSGPNFGGRSIVEDVKNARLGKYYQLWRALCTKGTVEKSSIALWEYLRDNPGDDNMLNRYHCSAALFVILGSPDPACKDELRKTVQWDHDGEEVRQEALVVLKEIIAEKLQS